MIVFHHLDQVRRALSALPGSDVSTRSTALAIGNFDGIHLGHQRLIASVVDQARLLKKTPALLTFFPHPVEVLRPNTRLQRLTTASEKLALIESLGIELVLVAPFDAALAKMEPEAFFEHFVVEGLAAKSVHVGFDFHFGKARRGDTRLLENLCKNRSIDLHVEPVVDVDGKRCSSTEIRNALAGADLKLANSMLGRPYRMTGQVVRGDGRGRKIGFPTANLRIPSEKLLPKTGVYLTQATWQHQTFKAVANLGMRPTFHEGETVPVLEVHFLDFDAQIYDEFVEISFIARIRDEQKFPSVDALIAQIANDVAWAREYQLG